MPVDLLPSITAILGVIRHGGVAMHSVSLVLVGLLLPTVALGQAPAPDCWTHYNTALDSLNEALAAFFANPDPKEHKWDAPLKKCHTELKDCLKEGDARQAANELHAHCAQLLAVPHAATETWKADPTDIRQTLNAYFYYPGGFSFAASKGVFNAARTRLARVETAAIRDYLYLYNVTLWCLADGSCSVDNNNDADANLKTLTSATTVERILVRLGTLIGSPDSMTPGRQLDTTMYALYAIMGSFGNKALRSSSAADHVRSVYVATEIVLNQESPWPETTGGLADGADVKVLKGVKTQIGSIRTLSTFITRKTAAKLLLCKGWRAAMQNAKAFAENPDAAGADALSPYIAAVARMSDPCCPSP
jgi:hypothetical protein